MIRWLLFLAIAIAAYHLFDSGLKALGRKTDELLGGGQDRRGGKRPADGSRNPPAGPSQDELVACDGCGVHVPTARTVALGSRRFCSERCRAQAARSA